MMRMFVSVPVVFGLWAIKYMLGWLASPFRVLVTTVVLFLRW